MIEIIVKSICENASKIECVADYIAKMDRRNALIYLLISAEIFVTVNAIKQNKEKIDELESELERIKSSLA